MSNSPLRIYGLEMPIDFPAIPYETIHSRMTPKKDTHPEPWEQFSGSWNAVAYRFLSCTEHSNEFTNSINQVGFAPPQPERYKQEKELFGFFTTGLATIESLCYGLFAIGSILSPLYFPILMPNFKKKVTPYKTIESFEFAYNGEPITYTLRDTLNEQEFKDWKLIRNILVHRSLPGRSYHHGGSHHGETIWIEGIQIDEDTTVSRRDWLVETLSELLEDMDTFTNSRL